MRFFRSLAIALVASCCLSGCANKDNSDDDDNGGGPGPGPSGNGRVILANGFVDAFFDNVFFRADSTIGFQYAGVFSMNAASLAGTSRPLPGYSVNVVITVPGPGSYVFTPANLGQCTIIKDASVWTGSPIIGQGSGDIVFTTLTANRAVGNFRCTAPPSPGNVATGTKVLTQGEFDITR
jgi:hypothetical protein